MALKEMLTVAMYLSGKEAVKIKNSLIDKGYDADITICGTDGHSLCVMANVFKEDWFTVNNAYDYPVNK